MKKNILVFPCGTEIGLEINRALANSKHFKLFGGNSVEDHGKMVYENYISNMPHIDSNNFVEVLNEIIETYEIDYVIPAHDSAVLKLAENRNYIKSEIITSPAETCRICRSKKTTYELFRDIIPTPNVYSLHEDYTYPIFLKPDVGQGSKGTYKAKNKQDVIYHLEQDPTLLILEYLPGKEYTVDCFTDRNGNVLFAEGRERIRINNGISVKSKPVNNSFFKDLAEKINKTLKLQGVWFYQIKQRHSGEFVLMEISPRIAGTMSLYRVLGINFIELSLFDRMGKDISILKNDYDIEIDRALFARYSIDNSYDYVYVDFDDTIVLNDKYVNTDIIKFLYQSKNMQKNIILLTKHMYDIKKTLNKFAISDALFDDIITVQKTQNKSDYIKNVNSIFIDDSYVERKEVSDKLKIPVYSLDAIESLLNWKV